MNDVTAPFKRKKFVPKLTPQQKEKTLDIKDHLNDDIPVPVKEAIELIMEPLPDLSVEMDTKVLEKHLLDLRDDHYRAAKMKREGKSYSDIAKILKTDAYTVKKYIDRVLHVHHRLHLKEAELLRQEQLERLDDMARHLHTEARMLDQIDHETGSAYLNSKQVEIMLKVMKNTTDLLGIEPPKKVQVEMSDQIASAQDKLRQRLAAYGAVIDVTPKVENK